MVLRQSGDRRPARLVKVGELRRIARARPVAVLVDDDADVCAAARSAGFTAFEATWGTVDGSGDTGANRTLHDAQEHDGRT